MNKAESANVQRLNGWISEFSQGVYYFHCGPVPDGGPAKYWPYESQYSCSRYCPELQPPDFYIFETKYSTTKWVLFIKSGELK